MRSLSTSMLFLIILLASCVDKKSDEQKPKPEQNTSKNILAENHMLSEKQLIDNVKKAISPQFKDWVLFSNGTYIILEDSTIKDKKERAIEIMKENGPVYIGSPSGDMSITKLTYTNGWVVGGDYYGMYTYVDPIELEAKGINDPKDIDVGLLGRAKRDKDGKSPKVIFVH